MSIEDGREMRQRTVDNDGAGGVLLGGGDAKDSEKGSPMNPMVTSPMHISSSGRSRESEEWAHEIPNPRQRSRMQFMRRMPPPRTTIAAALMLFFGTLFLCIGLPIYFGGALDASDRGISLIVLGSIMFIPGSYASVIIFGTWRGWSGYDYSQIPSYDD